jgi:hypothetical protein
MTRKFSTPLKHHGFLVALFYWLFGWIRCFLPYYRWFKLAERIGGECIYDSEKEKSTPVWQDIYVSIILMLTVLILMLSNWPHWVMLIPCVWILLDILVYYLNVLWLDDLEREEDRVWSHRRILFAAAINFAEMMAIFSILYRVAAGIPATVWDSLFRSFRTATTLDFPEAFLISACNVYCAHTIWGAQIFYSLFFIVIVIVTLAAMGFKRQEIASQKSSME